MLGLSVPVQLLPHDLLTVMHGNGKIIWKRRVSVGLERCIGAYRVKTREKGSSPLSKSIGTQRGTRLFGVEGGRPCSQRPCPAGEQIVG